MIELSHSPRMYGVQAKDREPLIQFMIDALLLEGCRIIHRPAASQAPFRITFETPTGERMGIIAYAFLATRTLTKNRPDDEHSFQVKYGTKDGQVHELWQDPYAPDDFDVVAACLHAVTERWEFRFARTIDLDRLQKHCRGKLSNRVHVDERWALPVDQVLRSVAKAQ